MGAPGPFDLTDDGLVDDADTARAALVWTRTREAGDPCGPAVDPATDVNHDRCIDVADLQMLADNFSQPTVRRRENASMPWPWSWRLPTP
jgi:hypothetical protein